MVSGRVIPPGTEHAIVSATLVAGLLVGLGGTVGLVSDEADPLDVPQPQPSESVPIPEGDDPIDPIPGMIGIAGIAAALAAIQRRNDELSPGIGLSLDAGPVVVFVPGYGQPQGSVVFADLIDYMDLDASSVGYFDYRWVDGGADASVASEQVGIDAATSALNAYLAGVAGDGREIYLVGFSKGGATIAELVADWDDGRWGPSASVVGAALLDPPIARGPLGSLQSFGRIWGQLPDDGGYNPVQCSVLRFGCSDRRVELGLKAGVEVIVIRNPKAGVTSFGDDPAGLRVYDAADAGPTIWGQIAQNPFALPGRIAEAHDAVLRDRRVADCIVAELRSGRCDLPRKRPTARLPGLTRGRGRAPVPLKML